MNGILDQQMSEGVQVASLTIGIEKRKRCFKCEKTKLLTEFYAHPGMKDGRLNKCKKCAKENVKQNYQENREHYRGYEKGRANFPHRMQARKLYAKTATGKEAGNRAKKKWAEQNPEKRAANIILGNAIRDGRIKKMPCELCGSEHRIHGHHEDYSKPLDVRWFCGKHHTEHHKEDENDQKQRHF